ncbi:MAG: endonuclease/exonuclease/phosphatase family protein [Saprospiraceae bacterium]|nr:endonuclease/exonuclease/phosphatase family protein [Saprospiraceae bacterium]
MPLYKNLNPKRRADKRTLERLLILREKLRNQIPARSQSKTLLLASWNIRDFDKPGFGARLDESLYYIAEIISCFDIVAVQEIYRDLAALNKLMEILGDNWKYVFSDAAEGRQGNQERIAFVYDSQKVRFGGLAGELVIPPLERKVKDEQGNTTTVLEHLGQIWRTPLICGFQAGWARFMLCNVHIQWGDSSADAPGRIREIEHIAKFLKKRSEDPTAWARKLILLGDFNIFSRKDSTYQVLEKAGFRCPEEFKEVYTNVARTKQYDQILLRERKDRFEVLSGGTFDFFETVFRDDDEETYKPYMVKKGDGSMYRSYSQWRTFQMSDHLPLWLELQIDYADEYLKTKLADA